MAWGQSAVTRPIMVDSTTLCPLCLCSSCIKLRPSHTLQPDNVVSSQLRQQLANWKGLRFAVSTKRWTTVISAPNCPFPPGGRSLSVFTCPHDPPLWYHVRFIFDPVCRLFLFRYWVSGLTIYRYFPAIPGRRRRRRFSA